jgi:hypothetical protein
LLLFQIFKDDFLSYVVRACWLVSFFFTPIYMFILLFFVIFGTKKSNIITYRSFWQFNYYDNFFLLLRSRNNAFLANFIKYFFYRFQFSIITGRTTAYTLFSFWLFFFFFGDFLILTLLNFSTLTELVPSNHFFSLKSHFFYDLSSYSHLLAQNLMIVIFFFSFAAVLYLINLKWPNFYFYLNFSFYFDLFFFAAICVFCKSFFVLCLALYCLVKFKA